MLIQSHIDKLIKIGVYFMTQSQKFLTDYAKTFKHQLFLLNGVDTRLYTQKVLQSFGVLQKDYKDLYI